MLIEVEAMPAHKEVRRLYRAVILWIGVAIGS